MQIRVKFVQQVSPYFDLFVVYVYEKISFVLMIQAFERKDRQLSTLAVCRVCVLVKIGN